MTNLKWLDQYSGETVDELLALENECRIDSLVVAFEQAVNQKSARDGIGALSKEEYIILAVEALEREVNNGGYSQFFINSSREYAPVIVDALLRIGCLVTAALTDEAIKSLHLSDLTGQIIDAAMQEDNDSRDKELNRIDSLYFASTEPIASQLFTFIRANKRAIRL